MNSAIRKIENKYLKNAAIIAQDREIKLRFEEFKSKQKASTPEEDNLFLQSAYEDLST